MGIVGIVGKGEGTCLVGNCEGLLVNSVTLSTSDHAADIVSSGYRRNSDNAAKVGTMIISGAKAFRRLRDLCEGRRRRRAMGLVDNSGLGGRLPGAVRARALFFASQSKNAAA